MKPQGPKTCKCPSPLRHHEVGAMNQVTGPDPAVAPSATRNARKKTTKPALHCNKMGRYPRVTRVDPWFCDIIKEMFCFRNLGRIIFTTTNQLPYCSPSSYHISVGCYPRQGWALSPGRIQIQRVEAHVGETKSLQPSCNGVFTSPRQLLRFMKIVACEAGDVKH